MWIGYTLLGFLAGTISGLGIGGGILLIPALGIIYGISQQAAQGITLLYFIPTAAIAIITHRKKGNIAKEPRILKLILFGLIGAGLGAAFAMWVDENALKKIFGLFLLFMGVAEIFRKEKEKNGSARI